MRSIGMNLLASSLMLGACFAAEAETGTKRATAKSKLAEAEASAGVKTPAEVAEETTGDDEAKAGEGAAPEGAQAGNPTSSDPAVGAVSTDPADTTQRVTRSETTDVLSAEDLARRSRELANGEAALEAGRRQLAEEQKNFEEYRTNTAALAVKSAQDQADGSGSAEGVQSATAEAVHPKLDHVTNATVQVIQKSYIDEALREPGYVSTSYTGEIGHNLRKGRVEHQNGAQVFIGDDED